MKQPVNVGPNGLRVLHLHAENVKKIRLVDIRPKADVIEFTGKNGAGKTSGIDAIMYALGGLKTLPSHPVRDGEEEMRIELELGDKVTELVVKRVAGADGESGGLLVETAKGARYDKPQQVLNELLTALSFDPSDFLGANAKEQLETLKRLVPLDIDLDEHDGHIQRVFDTRTGVGRERDHYKERAAAYLIGPEWPKVRIDESRLLEEMEEAADFNQEIERARARKAARVDAARAKADRGEAKKLEAERIREQIAALHMRAAVLDAEYHVLLREAGDDLTAALQVEVAPAHDLSEVRANIEQARGHNEKVRLYEEFQTVEKAWAAKESEYDGLSKTIDRLRGERTAAIARGVMPVKGLGFGEGEVTFNGLPLSQASGAEQLRVALGIVRAQNSTLRVVLVRDGSKFDATSRAIIRDFARDNNLQIFVERVDETGKVGVFFQDGVVEYCDPDMASALI